jgi:twitching motility protein PilI
MTDTKDTLSKSTSVEAPSLKQTAASRRTRLRDFQTQLMERMQSAKAGSHVGASSLGVMIGKERFLIDLLEAGEIVSSGNLTNVPLTKDWYLGVSNIRGNLTSVIDYSRFSGGSSTPFVASTRVLAFSNALAFNSGLLVSQVLGLRNSEEMQLIQAQENSTQNNKSWIVNQFIDRDGIHWSQLSLSLLIQDQDFLHIGL